MRVVDAILKTLLEKGIKHVYAVTGGAAMHLNDALGNAKFLETHYLHHEQSCSIAAESHARHNYRPCVVNITAGPGAINSLNGVFGAYVDSIPMIIISGQAKRSTLVTSYKDPNLRQLGDQEVDIIHMVQKVTKESIILEDPSSVSQVIDFAFLRAISGRKGPVWIDIPIDVQSTLLDKKYKNLLEKPIEVISDKNGFSEPFVSDNEINFLAKKILQSHRPTLYVGNGIRLSDAYDEFLRFIDKWPISTVTGWNSNDLLWDDHYCYSGRPGSVGNRAGNFCIQYSDVVCSLGTRLNIRQISFNWNSFAKNAWKCHVDIDLAELNKPTLNTNLKINTEMSNFFEDLSFVLEELIQKKNIAYESLIIKWGKWIKWNKKNLQNFSVTQEAIPRKKNFINPYRWIEKFSENLKEDSIIVCADGTACVVGFQAFKVKPNQRLYHNSGCASMGYEIPAAIGAYYATRKKIYCIAGDGSIMMNLQELAYIGGKKLPIKIFLFNNEGYHSIRQTQQNYFPDNVVGCGKESGLPFPDFKILSEAFGLQYKISRKEEFIEKDLLDVESNDLPIINEILLDLEQQFVPKLSSKKLIDGTMITSEIEDMYPFLPKQIMEQIKKDAFEI